MSCVYFILLQVPDNCATNPDGTKYGDYAIDETMWEIIREIAGVLWPVAQIVTQLQGQEYVTISLVLPLLGHLVSVLEASEPVHYQDERADTSLVHVDACKLEACVALAREALREAIVKRFFVDVEESDMEDIGIATFLDPRFKLLDFTFPDHHLVNATGFRQKTMSAVRHVWSRDWKQADDDEVEEVKESPLKKHATGRLMMKATSGLHAILSGRKSTDCDDIPEVLLQDELDNYGDILQVANKDIDPLSWWSMHAVQFPTLSKMARQFLAQPATSAACERVFNRAGRMHDDFKKGSSESTLNHALMVSINP